MSYNQWNKKQTYDVVDEDARKLGTRWIVAKYAFKYIVLGLLIWFIIWAIRKCTETQCLSNFYFTPGMALLGLLILITVLLALIWSINGKK